MALNAAALNSLASHLGTLITHLSLHSADPGAAGANETSAGREPAGWSEPVDGDITATNAQFTGGASKGPVLYVGYWSAVTAGVFYGSTQLPAGGDVAFNAAGEFTITSLTIDGD